MSTIKTAKFVNGKTARCMECKDSLAPKSIEWNKNHIYGIGTTYACPCGKASIWTNSIRDPRAFLAFLDGVKLPWHGGSLIYSNGFCNDKYCGKCKVEYIRNAKSGQMWPGVSRGYDRYACYGAACPNQKIAYWGDAEDDEGQTAGLIQWYKTHRSTVEKLLREHKMPYSKEEFVAKFDKAARVLYKGAIYIKATTSVKVGGVDFYFHDDKDHPVWFGYKGHTKVFVAKIGNSWRFNVDDKWGKKKFNDEKAAMQEAVKFV